jgi:hypothetical protein
MRVLIDECVDERLRLLFSAYDCQTARFADLAGLKNGRLLEAAEEAGLEVLITVDQKIPDHQNLMARNISVLILCGCRGPLTRRSLLLDLAANLHPVHCQEHLNVGVLAGFQFADQTKVDRLALV